MREPCSCRGMEFRVFHEFFADGKKMKCKKCGSEMKPMAVEGRAALRFCSMPPLTDCDECTTKKCNKDTHIYFKCYKCKNGVWT